MKWMEFECATPLLAEMPETRQHFFLFFSRFFIFTRLVRPGFHWMRESMASIFLISFATLNLRGLPSYARGYAVAGARITRTIFGAEDRLLFRFW
jgi:hypothetical protein